MNNNNMSDDEFEEPDDDADYEEYCGEDECTVVSGVSKESTIASHLLDLDANVPADEESDDEDLPTPMLARDDDDVFSVTSSYNLKLRKYEAMKKV
jgi:hypothetical protein